MHLTLGFRVWISRGHKRQSVAVCSRVPHSTTCHVYASSSSHPAHEPANGACILLCQTSVPLASCQSPAVGCLPPLVQPPRGHRVETGERKGMRNERLSVGDQRETFSREGTGSWFGSRHITLVASVELKLRDCSHQEREGLRPGWLTHWVVPG